MTPEEIRRVAIQSATAYYEYLDLNDKGIQVIDVYEMTYPGNTRDFIIKLRLSSKLFDTEAIFLKNLNNNRKYDTGEVKVIEYDKDKNILLIRPTEGVINDFKDLQSTDLKVISDLKFLVERVKNWYVLNGASIQLPFTASKLAGEIANIKYFPEKELQPSDNQKESLRNIFSNPFSYIWGAPGTGKTQFVLAYAVLQYLHNNGKVAILAPTNNSIEQVLRGIIKMTDKAGVERKDIIRLGTPSKKFAEEYPEVCEEKGVQKKLAEIDKQISILERIITYEQAIAQIRYVEDALLLFDAFPGLVEKITVQKQQFENESGKQKKKEIDLHYAMEELEKLHAKRNREELKLGSFGHKLKKIISAKPTRTETNLAKFDEEIKIKYKEVEFLKYESTGMASTVTESKKKWENARFSFSDHLDKIKLLLKDNPRFSTIINSVETSNWESKKYEIVQEIANQKEAREVDSHLIPEYKQMPIQQLQNELADYLILRTKLAAYSTEERLKTVKVIACTLDGYIGRFTETQLNVDHIFLDEAGYANIIKALSLFHHNVPISFLGDHMQLPPVCEINDSQMQQDENFRNMFLWAQSAIHIDSIFQKDRDLCLTQYLNGARFTPSTIKQTSLTSTFRFGDNLARILARYVYENNFNSLNPLGETQIRYVHAPKEDPLYSRISANEVEAIKRITESLRRDPDNNFVILAPYRKQISLLNRHLPQERNDLKILTVHGSQGREWDTVILSVVDTSDRWFVDTTVPASRGLNLINTAVSRAKKQLIIVCDKNYWQHQSQQLITDLLQHATEIKL